MIDLRRIQACFYHNGFILPTNGLSEDFGLLLISWKGPQSPRTLRGQIPGWAMAGCLYKYNMQMRIYLPPGCLTPWA